MLLALPQMAFALGDRTFPPCGATCVSGTDYAGGDMGSSAAFASLQLCVIYCLSTAGCTAVAYEGGGSMLCYPKRSGWSTSAKSITDACVLGPPPCSQSRNFACPSGNCIWNVTTLAGSGATGTANGVASSSKFYLPIGVDVGLDGAIYVADEGDSTAGCAIRRVDLSGTTTTLASSGSCTTAVDATGASASFKAPIQIDHFTDTGSMVLADYLSHAIRLITSPGGIVTTLAGRSGLSGYADGKGTSAYFNIPHGIAMLNTTSFFVTDRGNNRIRIVSLDGTVKTFAGSGVAAWQDSANPLLAAFSTPTGITVNSSKFVFIADGSQRIRLIDASTGRVSTLAGDGNARTVDGYGTSASLNNPTDVEVFNYFLFVTEFGNFIRRIDLLDSSARVITIAGTGLASFGDGWAVLASFNAPWSIAASPNGTLYIADQANQRIRALTYIPCPASYPCWTASPSASASPSPTPSTSTAASNSVTSSRVPSVSNSGSASGSITVEGTQTSTPTASALPSSTLSESPSASATSSTTPSQTPTSLTPSVDRTSTGSATATTNSSVTQSEAASISTTHTLAQSEAVSSSKTSTQSSSLSPTNKPVQFLFTGANIIPRTNQLSCLKRRPHARYAVLFRNALRDTHSAVN